MRQAGLLPHDVGGAGRLRAEEALALAERFGDVHPFVWDDREPETRASSGFRALLGLPADCRLTPADVLSVLHPEDREAALAAQAAALARGTDYAHEFRIRRPDGTVRWISSRGRVLHDQRGRPCGIAGVNQDITQRKEAELALARSEGRLRTILDTMPQIVWSALPDGNHDFFNARWHEFTGTPPGTGQGAGWNDLFHPDDRARSMERWQQSLASGEPYEIEYRLRRHDGAFRWTLGRALPIRDRDGRIERWFGTCTDIDDLKVAEEGRELVARELAHRIKNIFAVVNSLLMLSSRNRPEAAGFAEDARARIESLARAHDYVRPAGTTQHRATVIGLLTALLDPYGDRDSRVRINGDDIAIGATAATSLALVVHELATNAVKYGSLSTEQGRLLVDVEERGEALALQWREVDGPAISGPPVRRGFGTTLSERALKAQLGAAMETNWDPGGFAARITIPVSRLAL